MYRKRNLTFKNKLVKNRENCKTFGEILVNLEKYYIFRNLKISENTCTYTNYHPESNICR